MNLRDSDLPHAVNIISLAQNMALRDLLLEVMAPLAGWTKKEAREKFHELVAQHSNNLLVKFEDVSSSDAARIQQYLDLHRESILSELDPE